jgi:hypothetical protein
MEGSSGAKEVQKSEWIRELSLNASIVFSQRESFVLIIQVFACYSTLKVEALTRHVLSAPTIVADCRPCQHPEAV